MDRLETFLHGNHNKLFIVYAGNVQTLASTLFTVGPVVYFDELADKTWLRLSHQFLYHLLLVPSISAQNTVQFLG